MPKQRGVFKVNGTIDDTTFYEKDGVFYVRRAVKGPSKEKMMTSPRYARTRENMAEFGALAVTAKSLISAFNKVAEFKDNKLRQRLMSATRTIIKHGEGIRGRRSAVILPNKDALIKIELNAKEPLETLFSTTPVATHDAGRSKATAVITAGSINEIVTNAPPGATHVRFVQLLGVVSDTVFDEKLNKFRAADALINGKNAVTYSDYLKLTSTDAINVQLQTSLPDDIVLSNNVAVIQCFGILFDALENGAYYRQASGKAMNIVDVF